ncbi:MAG: rhodanese-like domain-containing protein [Xanthomonadales bacterium]|nr:rhodanese-like domain-containing protein [Xanthomonadales bacterium]
MQTLSKKELKEMNEQEHADFVLINVLPRDAFLKQHIRTSVNLPQDEDQFPELVAKVAADKDRKVVVYCANFDCPASLKATEKLEAAGFTKVYDYAGGTEDWFSDQAA